MEHGIVGGITGYIRDNSQINKCYNIGSILCESNVVGGIVGHVNGGTISNCYYLENTVIGSNDPTKRDGIEKKDSEQLKTDVLLLGDSYKEDSENKNQGYPILDWE